MSWLLTIAGFIALIVLHEFGHFVAAKAVGMRVERFALFFPPLLLRVRRGETEYAVGAIPLGGYVKITGMSPREELPPEVARRAYLSQPVWKRIVVIVAGPAMNVVIAFAILWAIFLAIGQPLGPSNRIDERALQQPAASALRPGDEIVAVDGRRGGPEVIRREIGSHRCPSFASGTVAVSGSRVDFGAGRPLNGCESATPAQVTVRRDGRVLTFELHPLYDERAKRMLLGFGFAIRYQPVSAGKAATLSLTGMWRVTTGTVSALARVFDPEQRRQISGVVGSSKALQERFEFSTVDAVLLLAIISLSLAIVNLFPFLPLDGGHIFWALAEKVRRRPIPFEVMERSMAVGFVLVITLFFIGLSNDIGRLQGEGFGPR
jgi:regulator of sigma E protease